MKAIESGGKIIGSYLVFEHESQDENGAYYTDVHSTEPMVQSSEVIPSSNNKIK